MQMLTRDSEAKRVDGEVSRSSLKVPVIKVTSNAVVSNIETLFHSLDASSRPFTPIREASVVFPYQRTGVGHATSSESCTIGCDLCSGYMF
jgi:hypothetical protein